MTLQLGDASRVAAKTGLPVVADFRQGDVAAGGQGAPLVPWTDWVLFRDRRVSRAVQNIGGIGNVSWLPAGGGPEEVIAFDTGPGNMLIDLLVGQATGGRQAYDRDGRRAARGRVLEPVLKHWMRHPFLGRHRRGPPGEKYLEVRSLKRPGRHSRGRPAAPMIGSRRPPHSPPARLGMPTDGFSAGAGRARRRLN